MAAEITREMLDRLIEGLEEYKRKGVIDPWVLSTGEIVEPLDVLKELRDTRTRIKIQNLLITKLCESRK